ncbi:MAG: tetratricopeptide repeat protein [Anaerolineae bacterium]|nr:tetratricopeptide repeat protein [Anaerolineae bacterium]
MSNSNSPNSQVEFQDWLKTMWAPLFGIMGLITLIVQFIQLWRGDQSTVTFVTAITGAFFIFSGLSWVSFSKRTFSVPSFLNSRDTKLKQEWRYPRYYKIARIGLFLSLLFCLIGARLIYIQQQELKSKIIILVAKFDGPEDIYGVTNELIEQLRTSLGGYKEILVIPIDKTIDTRLGSEEAFKIGERYLADIVIWGWYRPTENPNITLHIENLDSRNINILNQSSNLKPSSTTEDLQSFVIQQKLGKEMSALVLIISGYAQYNARDFEGALKRYEQALTQSDLTANIIKPEVFHFLLANAYLNTDDNLKAILEYDLALQIEPQNTSAILNQGVAFSKNNQKEKAIENYSLAIEINPSFTLAYLNRGATYIEIGEIQKGLNDINQLILIDPNIAAAYLNRGNAYFDLGENNKALEDYTKVIEIDPSFAGAYFNRGNTYIKMGEKEKAIKDYSQAIKIDPNYINAYYYRAAIYIEIEEKEQAIHDYTSIIMLSPNSSGAYFNRGLLYSQTDREELAIYDYTQVIKIDTNSTGAYLNRGNIYSNLGDKDKAIKDYTQAINIDPGYSDAYFNRAITYEELGEIEKALEDYYQVIKLTTNVDFKAFAEKRINELKDK